MKTNKVNIIKHTKKLNKPVLSAQLTTALTGRPNILTNINLNKQTGIIGTVDNCAHRQTQGDPKF